MGAEDRIRHQLAFPLEILRSHQRENPEITHAADRIISADAVVIAESLELGRGRIRMRETGKVRIDVRPGSHIDLPKVSYPVEQRFAGETVGEDIRVLRCQRRIAVGYTSCAAEAAGPAAVAVAVAAGAGAAADAVAVAAGGGGVGAAVEGRHWD